MNKPYVISAELDLASRENESVIDASRVDAFRESLDRDLRNCGKTTLWVSSSTLATGLARLVQRTRMPIVSLDSRYVCRMHYLHGHLQSS